MLLQARAGREGRGGEPSPCGTLAGHSLSEPLFPHLHQPCPERAWEVWSGTGRKPLQTVKCQADL